MSWIHKKKWRTFSATTGEIVHDMYDKKPQPFLTLDFQFNDKVIKKRWGISFDMDVLKKNVTPSKYAQIAKMLERLEAEDNDPVILTLWHLKK